MLSKLFDSVLLIESGIGKQKWFPELHLEDLIEWGS